MLVKINFKGGARYGKKHEPKEEETDKTKKVSQHRMAKVLYFSMTFEKPF